MFLFLIMKTNAQAVVTKNFVLSLMDSNCNEIKHIVSSDNPYFGIISICRIDDTHFKAVFISDKKGAYFANTLIQPDSDFQYVVADMDIDFNLSNMVKVRNNPYVSNTVRSTDSITYNSYSIIEALPYSNGWIPYGRDSIKGVGKWGVLFERTNTVYKTPLKYVLYDSKVDDRGSTVQVLSPNRILFGWITTWDTFARMSTQDILGDNGIKLYPNPINDELKLEISGAANQISQISIYDASGRLLYNTTSSFMQSINTQNYITGVYLLKINYKDGSISMQKFVKCNP